MENKHDESPVGKTNALFFQFCPHSGILGVTSGYDIQNITFFFD